MNPTVQPLIDALVAYWLSLLGTNLVGVYMHGSAAMGGFNPARSDLDLLIVVRDPLTMETKQAFARHLLTLSEPLPGKGLEMSVVLLRYTQDFVFPTPFEFHYSPDWHERYAGGTAFDLQTPTDPDLAAHFTVTRQRGICVYGEPIVSVFGDVPEQHYLSSLMSDADSILKDMTSDPIYTVLNLCRILAYQREGRILAKHEGGQWGIEHLAEFKPLIAQAMLVYESPVGVPVQWDEAQLIAFGEYMRGTLTTND